MPTASARVLALGGESRTVPIGRWETDYYLQRIVVATCSLAAMAALFLSLIPVQPGTVTEIESDHRPPSVAEMMQYDVAPPSIRSGGSTVIAVKVPPVPMPIPVADSELLEEPEIGIDDRGVFSKDPTAKGDEGSGGVFFEGGLPAARSATPDVFVFVEVPPELISLTNPVYPELAREAGVEGTVHVRVLVSEEGFVLDTLVLEGLPLLDAAAVEAARSAIFRPAQQSGQPVRTWVVMPIEFSLRR